MSASDIEKLVPNISKACQFNTEGNMDVDRRKHCMELTRKNVLKMTAPPGHTKVGAFR